MYQNGRVKKWRYNISRLLVVTILVTNFLPVFTISVFAEGEESSAPAPTESVGSSSDPAPVGDVPASTTPETGTATGSDSTSMPEINSTSETTTATTTNDTSTPDIFFGDASSTSETGTSSEATGTSATSSGFDSSGSTTLGTTTTTTSDPVATTTIICDEPEISSTTEATTSLISDPECEEYDMGTSTLPVGTTTIDTGDAVSTANILNILNTNSVNSTGTIKMINMDGHDGNLDLRSNTIGSGPSSANCSVIDCSDVDSVTAKISSNASIDNTVVLQASAGSNTVDTAQSGVINTGNTLAGLNLVNLANTNLIDSNYYILTLNSFNTINGDIILPALSKFFAAIASAGGLNINAYSDASTTNDLDVAANTGENKTENSLSSTINTGNANSATNIYNSQNKNLFGGNTVSILLRISGLWLGQALGLSEGQGFTQDGNLYLLQIDEGSDGELATHITNIDATTTAKITNDVKVLADGGNNTIKNTENALINTGDALAAANLVNISNTNVVGKNWMLAIINIFGDFNGNLAFGRGDMWVGEQVSATGNVANGSNLKYTLTIKNNGDVDMNGVTLTSLIDTNHLDIADASVAYTTDSSGNLIFDLGKFTAGESREISFNATVKNTNPGDAITNTSTAASPDPDSNSENNTDSATINAYNPSGGGGGGGTITDNSVNGNNYNSSTTNATTTLYLDPNQELQVTAGSFEITREVSSSTIVGSTGNSHQKIIIKNLKNELIHSAVFYDIIFDPSKSEMNRETWDLGDIQPNESIEVTYDITFGPAAQTGTYYLSSQLNFGPGKKVIFDRNGILNYVKDLAIKEEIEPVQEMVLGTSTAVTYSNTTSKPLPPAETGPSQFEQLLELFGTPRLYAQMADGAQTTIDADLMRGENIYYSSLIIFMMFISSLYMLIGGKPEIVLQAIKESGV